MLLRSSLLLLLLLQIVDPGQAFALAQSPSLIRTKTTATKSSGRRSRAHTSSSSAATALEATHQKKTLGLLTFDLDDSLYPIDVVMDEANAAFARAMREFGFTGIQPHNIAETCQQIRLELPPDESIVLTHTEVRRIAIRREMERVIYQRKLQETADDWATPVSDLSPIVKSFAKKWASEAVSESIVQAVLNAWEMERHHAAERHLYREVLPALDQIKRSHPNVIIGAVTDGKANPLFMTFTLAKYFDFCLSWEDDQVGRTQFFRDLGTVEGRAELKWIYDAALEKYHELSAAQTAFLQGPDGAPQSTTTTTDNNSLTTATSGSNMDDRLWIHVGDDLAYDVGGSFQSGAKTIWLELDEEKYGQTARQRFIPNKWNEQPSWSTSTRQELEKRRIMNELALQYVDKRIQFFSRLPEAIQEIVDEANEHDDAVPTALSVNANVSINGGRVVAAATTKPT